MPFCAIQAATNHNVRFLLKHRNDLGGIECAALKLESYNASIALYRSITEKHAFYSCETVRSAVTSQFVRDLKGTIASFFNENTDLGRFTTPIMHCRQSKFSLPWHSLLTGKKYIFDIQRTCREVYDNARRTLYQSGDPSVTTGLAATALATLHLPLGAGSSSSCSDTGCKVCLEVYI